MSDNTRCPTFETKRLHLRAIQPGDEEFLAWLDTDPDVMRYIHAGPISLKAALKWAGMQVETAPHRWHFHKWIVELREQESRIGWVELGKFRGVFDPAEACMNDDISIGYQFAPAYWRQGFASEAIGPVLAYSFDTMELDRLVAFVHPENNPSIRVLDKLGFLQHPTRRYKDEGGHKCYLYSLSISGWRNSHL